MWNFLRYRDPKANDPHVRQVEKAGWVGFYLGFILGIATTVLLLGWG